MKKETTPKKKPVIPTPPTNEDVAAYVAGVAERRTAGRVLRDALTDSAARESLTALLGSDRRARRAAADTSALPPGDAGRAESLRAKMRAAAVTVAREYSAAAPASEPAAAPETLAARVGRALQTGRALLTLPCLAPATASAAALGGAPIHRQTIQTGDGVRIEFQQLPGEPPYRLRVIVDASQLPSEPHDAALPAPTESAYDVAYLTLEEGDSGNGPLVAPTRHLLIVPLNAQTRGFADFVVGGNGGAGGTGSLPAPFSACRLVSATLAKGEPGNAGLPA